MDKHQHNDDLIKKKIEQHEFDFQDRAWENMNDLLDGSTMPKRKAFLLFFNRKTLSLMIILILLIGLSVNQIFFDGAAQPIPITENQVINESTSINEKTIVLEEIAEELPAVPFITPLQSAKIIETSIVSNLINTIIPKQYNTNQIPSNHQTPDSYRDKPSNTKIHQPDKVYLHLDRTMFKPGEAIWFSAYIRNSETMEQSSQSDVVYVELIAPNGNVEKKATLITSNGQVAGDFLIGKEAAGGLYKIKAYTNWQRNFGDYFERKIQVQKSVLPNLRMNLEFVRKAYGASDEVIAKLELNTLANEALKNHDFTYTASLNGQVLKTLTGKTDEKGWANLHFNLPDKLKTNNGLVNVMINYNGQTESIARPIPIVLNKIDLQFLPEGGEMIAGFESKVAFKAINEFGKPADVEGKIVDVSGNQVATFKSYHQGMGAFDFMPKNTMTYFAQITQPKGITEYYRLPNAVKNGTNLQVKHKDKTTLAVKINTTNTTQPNYLIVQAQGKTYSTKKLEQRTTHEIEIPTKDLPLGVVALTVTDANHTPNAERLVFVNPHKQLKVNITTDKEKYLPREKVAMTIKVTDEKNQPVSGQFSLSVVDDKLLSFADDKQGHILSYMLLESELKGKIEEPNFYFESKEKHPEKDQLLALDYLMLTQGWRTFENVDKPLADLKYKAERARITGVLVDKNDQPIQGATIKLYEAQVETTTNEKGEFALLGVPKSRDQWLYVFLEKGGKGRKIFELPAYEENLKLKVFDNIDYAFNLNLGEPVNSDNAFSVDNSTEKILLTSNAKEQPKVIYKKVLVETSPNVKYDWIPVVQYSQTNRNLNRFTVSKGSRKYLEIIPLTTFWAKRKINQNCQSSNLNDCLVWALIEKTQKHGINLANIPYNTILEFPSINQIKIEGQILDKNTYEPISSAIVRLENECGEDISEYVTDADGMFVFEKLSDTCCYTIQAKKVPIYFGSQEIKFCGKHNTAYTASLPLETSVYVYAASTDSKSENKQPSINKPIRRLIKPATTREVDVPAEYQTVTKKVVRTPAITRTIDIPAEYKTITKRVLKTPAEKGKSAIYETITEQVMVKAPSTRIEVVPAEYETITEQVLAKAASTRLITVPAEYETVTIPANSIFQNGTIDIRPQGNMDRPLAYSIDGSSILANSGTINLTASGALPNYTYNWTATAPTTTDFSNFNTGTYTINVTDVNGAAIYKTPEDEILQKIQAGNVALPSTKQGYIALNKSTNDKQGTYIVADSIDIGGLLQGQVAGVNITQEGEPGAGTEIRIRGAASLYGNSQQPLYVVDGVPINREDINKLVAEDIDEIMVLKDASATAIYGSRGAYGVIIVTTKGNHKENSAAYKRKIKAYITKETIKFEEKKNKYINSREEAIVKMQTGKLSLNELYQLRKTIENESYKLDELQKHIEDIAKIGAIETDLYFPDIEISDLIGNYERAKKFKTGYYKARKFYAPKYEYGFTPTERSDFRSTIYWNPTLEVGQDGKATIEFYNSDAITTFKAVVEGIGNGGNIGRGEQTYFTQLPFGMIAKLPTVVTTGDIVKIPVTLSNHTNDTIVGKLTATVPSNFVFQNQSYPTVRLAPQTSQTVFLPYKINYGVQTNRISVFFETEGHQDAISETVEVLEKGFPVNEIYAGKALEKTYSINIERPIERTVKAKFTAYPSVLSDMAESAERMFRQPTGCFEQTSSKNYPNLLALSYLKSTNTIHPDLESKAYRLLDKGYKRLLTFEVKQNGSLGGFDWYGKPPAHEGLTAYGLMQFTDMKKIYPVSQELIDRTAAWLLGRRDGKGSWKRDSRGRFGNSNPKVGDSYIVWAMTEAGYGEQIDLEIETTYEHAMKSKDAYIMALVANTLQKMGDKRAAALLAALLKTQAEDGSWTGKRSFIGSYGKSLKVETTALVTLAMLNALKMGEDGRQVASIELKNRIEKAIQFIASAKNQYGFGSTQSTILAMKALIAYTHYTSNQTEQNGEIVLLVDGKAITKLPFNSEQSEALVFENLEAHLQEGKQEITVRFDGVEQALSYDIELHYMTNSPRSSEECKVDLETTLAETQIKQGETVRLTTTLTNKTTEDLPNTIAIVGIPAGLSWQPWQLKELQEQEVFDYYELLDGYIVFHYRGMEANHKKIINLELKADIPGNYEAPASVGYLYYVNELVDWSAPLRIEIQ